MSKYGVFSGLFILVFSPNTGKYRPEKTLYLDTYCHTVWIYACRSDPKLNHRIARIEEIIKVEFSESSQRVLRYESNSK